MSGALASTRMLGVLWLRDLVSFGRQRARIAGALVPPLLLWLALGAGIAPSFSVPGGGLGYMEYFFPGILFFLLLQVSITATMSVIEDRREGFLQGVLVAPGSRSALALGKCAGSASVALVHAALFLLLCPLAGFAWSGIDWLALLAALALTSLALAGMGFALAWALDSVQGYHLVMNLVLFPLWLVSGAMFPAARLPPVLAWIVRVNPASYAQAALRRALYGGQVPPAASLSWTSAAGELAVLAAATAALVALACIAATRRPAG